MGIMLIICFSDYWHNKEYLQIESDEHRISDQKFNLKQYVPKRRLKCTIDAITYFYLRRELIYFTKYRSILLQNPALRDVDILRLQIIPPKNLGFDWIW